MSLAARLKEAQVTRKPAFQQWLESLDQTDRDALLKAAASPLSSKKLLSIVRAEGGSIGEDAFKDWRVSLGYVV